MEKHSLLDSCDFSDSNNASNKERLFEVDEDATSLDAKPLSGTYDGSMETGKVEPSEDKRGHVVCSR